jgi:hypothetical protein
MKLIVNSVEMSVLAVQPKDWHQYTPHIVVRL